MWTTPSLRTGAAVLVTITVWLTPWAASHVKEVGAADSVNDFTFRTPADAALTEWAFARFEQAGLDLPPVAIAFHDGKEPCHGNLGFHRSGTPARIDICGFNWDRFVTAAKKTILHELGHAWTDHTLTEEARQRFLSIRGLTSWADGPTPWESRGSEHAAEIIAWALMDQATFMTGDQQRSTREARPGLLELTGNLPLQVTGKSVGPVGSVRSRPNEVGRGIQGRSRPTTRSTSPLLLAPRPMSPARC